MRISSLPLYFGVALSSLCREGNPFRLALSCFLLFCYVVLPSVGYGYSSDISSHVFYIFSHANIWHLLANIVCIWLIRCPFHLVGSLLVVILCSFLPCFTSELTYGFSGVLFCTVGISWGVVGRFRDMLWKNKWYFLIPFLLPHVNVFLHLYCALLGYLLGYCVYRNVVRYKQSEII